MRTSMRFREVRGAGKAVRDRRTERISQQGTRPARVGSHEVLVDPGAGQEAGRSGTRDFLDGVDVVVEKIGGRAVDGLAGAAARRVVDEGGRHGAADRGEAETSRGDGEGRRVRQAVSSRAAQGRDLTQKTASQDGTR